MGVALQLLGQLAATKVLAWFSFLPASRLALSRPQIEPKHERALQTIGALLPTGNSCHYLRAGRVRGQQLFDGRQVVV